MYAIDSGVCKTIAELYLSNICSCCDKFFIKNEMCLNLS